MITLRRQDFPRTIATAIILSSALFALLALAGCEDDDGLPISSSNDSYTIFGDSLAPGLDMGVNSSGGLTDWLLVDTGAIEMSYPSGQSWGAVFITVGEPTDPPRPARDLTEYSLLAIELRGEAGGETVWISIKDNTDPDDGKEAQVMMYGLSTEWEGYELPLSQFYTVDFDSVYMPIGFVFRGGARTVYARSIEYRR